MPSIANGKPDVRDSHHVQIQRRIDSNRTIVCIPGAGDSIASFIPFSSELPEENIIGMQHPGLDGCTRPHTTVEAMAAAYARDIEDLIPRNEVHLVGHSFGGWVALQIGLELQRVGNRIASITIVDSDIPSPHSGGPLTFDETIVKYSIALERSFGKPIRIASIDIAGRSVEEKLAFLHSKLVACGAWTARTKSNSLADMVRTYGAAISCGYSPKERFVGRLTLIAAKDFKRLNEGEFPISGDEILAGWRNFAPNAVGLRCSGDHYTILRRPNVMSLAKLWKKQTILSSQGGATHNASEVSLPDYS